MGKKMLLVIMFQPLKIHMQGLLAINLGIGADNTIPYTEFHIDACGISLQVLSAFV